MANPFCKWGIDFMTFHPPSSNRHKYIVVEVDYFTKWAEPIPTFNNTIDTTTHLFFNHVITCFRLPQQLVSDHGKHFENNIFGEISSKLGFSHDFSSPYYPQSNGKVKSVNKVLKTMLQCTVNKHKTNWHHMLFSSLWVYRTIVKTATGFTPFHLVHGIEATLPIECEIPTLRIIVEILPDISPIEKRLMTLEFLDEDRRSSLQHNEVAKK
jgi:transposase InsO family protein